MIFNPKVGDRVKAKSGGPVMTVESVESDVYGEDRRLPLDRLMRKPASGTFTLSALVKA